jgi:hypothetical protein
MTKLCGSRLLNPDASTPYAEINQASYLNRMSFFLSFLAPVRNYNRQANFVLLARNQGLSMFLSYLFGTPDVFG